MSLKKISLIATFGFVVVFGVIALTSGPSLCGYETISFWQVDGYKEKAKSGDADAAITLYDYYGGCSSAEEEQNKWFELAARNGNKNFQLLYGRYLLKQQKVEEGLRWIKTAADSNYYGAILEIAELHEIGKYVEKDLPISVEYYKTAADMGSLTAMVKLSSNLSAYVSCQDRKNWLEHVVEKTKPLSTYHEQASQILQSLNCK